MNYATDITVETLNTITTECKSLNWLISKATVEDKSDKYGYHLIGRFNGTLNFTMVQEIKAYIKKVAGDMFASAYTITDNQTYEIVISFETGSYKSDQNKARFTISYTKE